jgi:hypothetical protein
MERASPAVDADEAVAAVHIEMLVVQVVNAGMAVDRRFIGYFDLVEAGISKGQAGPQL